MQPHRASTLGRAAAGVAESITGDISAGRVLTGQFLSPVRELALRHGVDRETVRRALKSIENRGLVAAVPRQGYRVLARAQDPDRGCPLALIAGGKRSVRAYGSMGTLMAAIRDAAERRGWSMLAAGTGGKTPREVVANLRAARSFGIALDVEDPELVSVIRNSGIPAVMLNSFDTSAQLDSVMQDGFLGGVLAVQYLLERSCKRIAWFGNAKHNEHTRDRFGGAAAAMNEAGLCFEKSLTVTASHENAKERARTLMSGRNRPDGIVCLWRSRAVEFGKVARELGLRVGHDFYLVAWCPEELHDETWDNVFGEGLFPAVVNWSIRTMAESTLARLVERRENPSLAPLRVKVPVSLRLPR